MEKNARCNISFKYTGFFLILFFIMSLNISWAQMQSGELTEETISDFMTLYPGVYTEKEKTLVEKYFADNKSLDSCSILQGLIDGTIEDTPGVGRTVKVTETMVRYYNEMRDPENPVLNNAEYARKLGYKDIIAYPSFAGHDDTFIVSYPKAARDTLLVADLYHSNTFYEPIYPGDTLYLVNNSRTSKDLTPEEGSIYRSMLIVTDGSAYNQSGEKVMDVTYSVEENLKIYKEGATGPNWEEWKGVSASQGGGGTSSIYYYTDADWEKIKDIWSKEKRQGSKPLYWEDVKIGDQPTWTLEGPLDIGISVGVPWGMGLGGNRTLKKEIMDPDLFKTLVRDEKDGIYRPADPESYIPQEPAEARTGMASGEMGEVDAQLIGAPGGDMPEGGGRSGGGPGGGGPGGGGPGGGGGTSITYGGANMMNFARRDLAIRHIHDWIGDYGWLYNIRWKVLGSDDMIALAEGKPHPAENPYAEDFFEKVPKNILYKKSYKSDKNASFLIVKSYVYDKFVQDGEFFVDIVWWEEEFPNGNLWGIGGATVKLPSKKAK